jgi:hypothetical protein
VRTAARTRTLDEPSGAPAADGGPADGEREAASRPDVDALARQVYDVLKRRLAAERRRGI